MRDGSPSLCSGGLNWFSLPPSTQRENQMQGNGELAFALTCSWLLRAFTAFLLFSPAVSSADNAASVTSGLITSALQSGLSTVPGPGSEIKGPVVWRVPHSPPSPVLSAILG